jgi:hypothetical protein
VTHRSVTALNFVYNADAGIAAGIMDSIHKVVSPDTYACDLCAITHGLARMNPKWKAWLKTLPFPTRVYHRPDFRATYPAMGDVALPLVLVERGGQPQVLIAAEDFAGVDGVDALIALIEHRLAAIS